ncbi:hypothetical protein C8Q76DRAFT_2883 [Earliella scabrosa]|nr:hypothetical protein C8Q76DRAFT_2883 [Earliella scabrosa]
MYEPRPDALPSLSSLPSHPYLLSLSATPISIPSHARPVMTLRLPHHHPAPSCHLAILSLPSSSLTSHIPPSLILPRAADVMVHSISARVPPAHTVQTLSLPHCLPLLACCICKSPVRALRSGRVPTHRRRRCVRLCIPLPLATWVH